MSEIIVVQKNQRLIIDPPSKTVAVMALGPMGPTGPAGPAGPTGPTGPAVTFPAFITLTTGMSFGGTGWALGNGTISLRYRSHGGEIHYRGVITMGTTSTYGAGSSLSLNGLPVAMRTAPPNCIGSIRATKSGVDNYHGLCIQSGPNSITFQSAKDVKDALSGFVATAPFTWAANDSIEFDIRAEAA